MKSSVNLWFAKFGMNILIKYKYLFFILYVIIVFLSIKGLQHLIMDNSYRSMLDPDDPISMNNEIFSDLFGNSDYVFLLIESENVVETEVLKYAKNLGEDIEQRLPFVKDYLGITNVEYIATEGDELVVEDLVGEKFPLDQETLNELRQKIRSKEFYENRIVNDKHDQMGILVRFHEIPDTVFVEKLQQDGQKNGVYLADQIYERQDINDPHQYKLVKDARSLITPALLEILDQHENKFTTTATGAPVSNYHIMHTLQRETGKTFGITMVVAILLLIILYRSFPAVIAPVITIVSAIIITFGLVGWLGIVISTFALVVALLLLVISIGYSIHLINHFRQSFFTTGNRLMAVRYTYEHSGWPCFISAVTTVIGFISFVVVDMVPVRNMGITCAIGVLVTFILIMFLVPAFLSFGKNKTIGANDKLRWQTQKGNEFMRKWAALTIRNYRLTSVITTVIIVLCVISVFQIKADTNYINLFGEKNKFVRDAIHSTENIGSLYSYEILIELPEEGMVKNPEVLKEFENLDKLVNTFPTTKVTSSVNNLIKDIHKTMHDNDSAYFKIPETQNMIAQYLLLYEMSGGDELENWVDFGYQNLRNSVRVKESTTTLIHSFIDIKQYVKNNFPEGTKVIVAGDMAIMLRAVTAMVKGQVNSVIFAFIGITLMMMISLRSVRGGLVSMIPNIIPIFFVFGFMGLTGITLNIQSMVVAPLILGIAVDDTVHYFLHYKHEFNKSKNYRIANEETFSKVGWALVNTSIILILGFVPYLFSIVKSLNQLAVLTMLGVLIALLGDLLITPALFNWLQPFGKPVAEKVDSPEVKEQEITEV